MRGFISLALKFIFALMFTCVDITLTEKATIDFSNPCIARMYVDWLFYSLLFRQCFTFVPKNCNSIKRILLRVFTQLTWNVSIMSVTHRFCGWLYLLYRFKSSWQWINCCLGLAVLNISIVVAFNQASSGLKLSVKSDSARRLIP